MNNAFQIEKLDDTNYESWCVLMKSVLIHSGLWRLACGEKERPEEKANAEKWDLDDEKALASIILSVKPTQLGYIKNAKTAAEAWKKLEAIYQPKGPIQKVCLYKRLLGLQMSEGSNMVQHLKTFTETTEKLAGAGIEIQEELLVVMLLGSLSKEYDHFVIAMETRDSLPDLSFLKQKLLEEAERRKEKIENENETTCQQQQAFNVRTQKQSKQSNANNNRNKSNFKGKCYNCGVIGHFASQCKAEKKNQKQRQQQFALTMLAATQPTIRQNNWYLDSGATSHMCADKKSFVSFYDHDEEVMLASDKFLTSTGKGDVFFRHGNFDLTFENTLYSPELQGNFLSVSKIVDKDLIVIFDAQRATVKKRGGEIVLEAKRDGDLFVVNKPMEKVFAINNLEQTWHNRFGHLNYSSLRDLHRKGMVMNLDIGNHNNNIPNCHTCMRSKIHTLPFPNESDNIASKVLDVVHSDVCGPFRISSVGGAKYFITFIDDKSRMIFIYFMKAKSEALEKFKMFQRRVENEKNSKIKVLRTDNGREYINGEFEAYLQQQGIQRQLTVPYTPQQNGVAERCNRTLVEMSRSMLVHSGVQQNLWAEAINTAAYIRNRCPTKILNNETPYESWYGRIPNVKHLRTFGCYAVALNKTNKSKFMPKGEEKIMVGYSTVSKAYRLFDKRTQKIVEQRDVLFDENEFSNKKRTSDQENQDKEENYLVLNIYDENNTQQTDQINDEYSDQEEEDFEGFSTAEENLTDDCNREVKQQ